MTELSNSVLVVGASDGLASRTADAARAASGGFVTRAGIAQATSLATETRPFAIVLPQELYDFGGDDFDALARDVHAELVVVPDNVQGPVLEALLLEAAARLA